MPAAELTEEMIATAMAKADQRVCVGNDRYYPFGPAGRCPRDLHAKGTVQGRLDRAGKWSRELGRGGRGEHGFGSVHPENVARAGAVVF
jgi:hypothetical protein